MNKINKIEEEIIIGEYIFNLTIRETDFENPKMVEYVELIIYNLNRKRKSYIYSNFGVKHFRENLYNNSYWGDAVIYFKPNFKLFNRFDKKKCKISLNNDDTPLLKNWIFSHLKTRYEKRNLNINDILS